MTPKALATYLFSTYEQYRLNYLQPGNCRHEVIVPELHEIVGQSGRLFGLREVGRSLEGRSINLLNFGHGSKRVLLWSQMHGDETTATLALMDILNFLRQEAESESWVQEMLEQISVYVIPMLNPDGAARAQRATAAQIDMNRDALVLATPEARLLTEVHRQVVPGFGFNLHDQPLYSVGNTKRVAALSLLAPALDEDRSTPLSRVRAMRVGALIACTLGQFIEGHIARYDDTFEPRAFGDIIQSRGTSTLLIESGHWPRDPAKAFVRKLNYVALLTSLRSIGNGSYQDVELDHYSLLKPNGKSVFDVIIKEVLLEASSGWTHPVDLGLLFLPTSAEEPDTRVSVKEIGDLSFHGALETIPANGRKLSTTSIGLDRELSLSELLGLLQIYHDRYARI